MRFLKSFVSSQNPVSPPVKTALSVLVFSTAVAIPAYSADFVSVPAGFDHGGGAICGTTTINVPLNPEDDANCPANAVPVDYAQWFDSDCWLEGGVNTGNTPSTSIGASDTVVINHHMLYNNGNELVNNGTVNLAGGALGGDVRPSLFLPSGTDGDSGINSGINFKNTSSGTFRIFNAQLDHWRHGSGCGYENSDKGGGSVTNEGGTVLVVGSRVETVQDWASTSSGGTRVHQDSCIFTGQNYSNSGGNDSLIRVCADLSSHGSGNFQANSGSIFFDDFEIFMSESGNIELKGNISGTSGAGGGGIQYAESQDKIVEDASGSVDLERWAAPNGIDQKGNLTGTLLQSQIPNFSCTSCQSGAPPLIASATGVCSGTQLDLTGSRTGGFDPGNPGNFSFDYSWSSSPDIDSNITDIDTDTPVVDLIGVAPGNYTFTLTVTDDVGISAIAGFAIEVQGAGCVPTQVVVGDAGVEIVEVVSVLDLLDIENKSLDELIEILLYWNPDIALPPADKESVVDSMQDYLDPDDDGKVVYFTWETLSQSGTLGFFVQRQDDSGNWNNINKKLLPAAVAPFGAEYLLLDPGVSVGSRASYRLVEQEARGAKRYYGPYELDIE